MNKLVFLLLLCILPSFSYAGSSSSRGTSSVTDVSHPVGVLPEANGGTNNSTALTEGSIVFKGASGYTQDNTNLYWDDTNNRLGIGTNTPNTTLHVVGTTTLSVPLAATSGGTGASSLGCGLTSVDGVLNTSMCSSRTVSDTTATITGADAGKIVTFSGASGAVSVTSASAASEGLTEGFGIVINNNTDYTVTWTPTGSTINGSASQDFLSKTGCYVYSDGTNYLIDRSSCSSIISSITIGTSNKGLLTIGSESVTRGGSGQAGAVLSTITGGTITDSTSSGTIARGGFYVFNPAKMTSSTATTYTDWGTVVINGTSSAGANTTFTNNTALYVYGSAKLSGTVSANVNMSTPNFKPNSGGNASAGANMFSSASNTLNFATSGAERVRIDPDGYISIGTTSAVSGALLTVDGAISASGGSENHGVCWKANNILGYCSSALNASGVCTCN